MEDILVLILQALFEFIVEGLSYSSLDWSRDRTAGRAAREAESLFSSCVLWFIFGCALAAVSLLVFRHTLIAVPALRVANLVAAPLTSAYLAQFLAGRRARRNRTINPRHRFWQAFWFTLGLVLIRFVYASRG